MIWLILVFASALFVTLYLTPAFIKKLKEAGMVGRDVHKEGLPEVPEMGGLVLLFGLATGIFISIPFIAGGAGFLFAAFLTILITGIIGFCDDLFGIKQKVKAFLPIFASIPLMVMQAGTSTMILPFIGLVDFGIFYPLLIIPAAITVASNSTNMLAGYNGLEAGLGIIASVFLGIGGVIVGRPEVSVLMFALAGGLAALLRFNYYPARIFLGDVGTFTIGSAIAAVAIIGNMETAGIIVLGAFIVNGIITVQDLLKKKPIKKFSEVKNGVLVPPEKKYVYTLYYFIESMNPMTEKRLVWIIWGIGFMFGVLSLAFLATQI